MLTHKLSHKDMVMGYYRVAHDLIALEETALHQTVGSNNGVMVLGKGTLNEFGQKIEDLTDNGLLSDIFVEDGTVNDPALADKIKMLQSRLTEMKKRNADLEKQLADVDQLKQQRDDLEAKIDMLRATPNLPNEESEDDDSEETAAPAPDLDLDKVKTEASASEENTETDASTQDDASDDSRDDEPEAGKSKLDKISSVESQKVDHSLVDDAIEGTDAEGEGPAEDDADNADDGDTPVGPDLGGIDSIDPDSDVAAVDDTDAGVAPSTELNLDGNDEFATTGSDDVVSDTPIDALALGGADDSSNISLDPSATFNDDNI